MEKLMRLVIVLLFSGAICAAQKPVLLKDNSTGQLFTSSLLTWENFNNDPNQLKHAVVGGIFNGEDVSLTIGIIHVIMQLNFHCRAPKHMFVVRP